MLEIHGGPHACTTSASTSRWQDHAANGYVMLYTNPRGSTGYGSAFGNAIKNAYPGKDYDDLMAGVDAVIGQGFVDPQNLFVYGCSGGGVLTAGSSATPNASRPRRANCPVINWLSFVGTTDGASWYYNFAKLPWEDPSEHLKPLAAHVRRQREDADDADDRRQRPAHADAADRGVLQRAQAAQGADGHDPLQRRVARDDARKPSNFMRTQLYLRNWFDKYKRGPERKTTTPASENR